MTLEEYENEIKELKGGKQPKRWKPKYRDTYYLVDYAGHVYNTTWDNANVDEWYYLTGNYFKTEEEAEEYKKQIEYTARYKNYIEEHSEPLDWNDFTQGKCFVEFHCISNAIDVDYTTNQKVQGTIYASSGQIIWDAIDEIGEDNFKKYVLGVK